MSGRAFRGAFVAAAVAAFAALSWRAHGGLVSPAFDVDTYDYAQMARQVSRGEGFTMQQSFPYVLTYLAGRGVPAEPPWPNTTRFPLIGVEEAAVFAVTGATDRGILVTGGVLFVLTAACAFVLGARLFGPAAGVLAAVAIGLEPEQLRLSRSGLLETGAGVFLVLATYGVVAVTTSVRSALWLSFAAGLVLGLSFLQRYDLLAIAPVALLLVATCGDAGSRVPRVAACIAGFAAAAGPWLVRNVVTIGTLLGSTSVDRNLLGGIVAGDVYMTSAPQSAWQVALENWPRLLAKFPIAAAWFVDNAGRLFGGPLATAAAVVFLACPLVVKSRSVRTAWLFAVGAVVARATLLSIMHNEVRFYASFAPVIFVLAAGTVIEIARRFTARAEAGGLVAAILVAAVALVRFPDASAARLPDPPEPYASLGVQVPPRTLVASDSSWNVAWYSDRPSVRFSGQWPEIVSVEQAGARVGAVLLRGPYAKTFDAALDRGGAQQFRRAPDIAGGYRLWLRADGSPPLEAIP